MGLPGVQGALRTAPAVYAWAGAGARGRARPSGARACVLLQSPMQTPGERGRHLHGMGSAVANIPATWPAGRAPAAHRTALGWVAGLPRGWGPASGKEPRAMPVSAPNCWPNSFHRPEHGHQCETPVAPAPGCEPCSPPAACIAAALGRHRAAFSAAHRRGFRLTGAALQRGFTFHLNRFSLALKKAG